MNREEILYLAPYLFSLLLSVGVFLYTRGHRQVRGARAYSWFVGGQTLTILGFIFELISPNLQIKILWDKFQWITDTYLVIPAFISFAIQFSDQKLRRPRLLWGIVIGFLAAFAALLLTDDIHHFFYPNPHLSTDYPFPELQYDFTIWIYLYALLYLYAINFYCLGLLIRRALQPYNVYRNQYWTIAAGFSLPLLLSLFSFANVRITPQRDVTPFSLALGNLIVAWGLFHYRLFDIVPIARERIIENLRDPILVLDAKNRVLDVNQAALKLLRTDISQVVRRRSSEVLMKWPEVASMLEYLDVDRKEIALQEDDDTFYYDITISSIYSNTRQLLGRILAARDITRYKTLEHGYRLLSLELEQRVRERTEELRHSAEQYRAVVENQKEFIVRWKADGVRTFANEAYCRYFGLTPEQAISGSFLAQVAKEDRRAIEAKIARLQAGTIGIETEIHRVIKSDGSIGWQEWTDQAIRDEQGNLIEFQSVGRDITERRQAEEKLAEAYETTLEGWAKALELRDKETEGHSRRVTEATVAVARVMGFNEEELMHVRRGSILHDIGKMGIPDDILRKNGPLTAEERLIVQKHPITAYHLLKPISYLEKAIEIPYYHHEKWDGSGYPCGLKGDEIPLAARIFAVVDVWDALRSDRPYRNAWPPQKVAEYLSAESGKHFDPRVVDVFLQMMQKGEI